MRRRSAGPIYFSHAGDSGDEYTANPVDEPAVLFWPKAADAEVQQDALEANQAPFYPYLAGYVAFYGGDYKTAAAELAKANQNDPFILAMLAQTHEKLGNDDQARVLYTKVLESTAHNPTNAYARPLAQKKLAKS